MDAIAMRQLHVQSLENRLKEQIHDTLCKRRADLKHLTSLLDKISPYALWKRGYAAVCNENGTGVRSIKVLTPGNNLFLYLQDGQAAVTVTEVRDGR
jgi:exonuclease VII large subunit